MSRSTVVLRSLHDIGLAAWFGGGLMGAVGVNSTARRVSNLSERHRVSAHGWSRWSPVSAVAIGAHAVGAAGLLLTERDHLAHDPAARATAVAKAGLTGAALGLTVLAEKRADMVEHHLDGPDNDAPEDRSAGEFAHAQEQLRVLRWAVPVLTGAAIVLGALERPTRR
jgi:hypothetical protein